ncbi:MAG: hypothetical protein MZV65_19300 [Chromatiales bacterium]|nr:hypothetical protein [Chromatiales bacterium]
MQDRPDAAQPQPASWSRRSSLSRHRAATAGARGDRQAAIDAGWPAPGSRSGAVALALLARYRVAGHAPGLAGRRDALAGHGLGDGRAASGWCRASTAPRRQVAPLFFWVVRGGMVGIRRGRVVAAPGAGAVHVRQPVPGRAAGACFCTGLAASVTRRLPLVLLGGFFWVASRHAARRRISSPCSSRCSHWSALAADVAYPRPARVAAARRWRSASACWPPARWSCFMCLPVALLAPLWARGTVTMPWQLLVHRHLPRPRWSRW